MDRRLATAVAAGALLGFAAAAYPALWRDRCLHWGARADEVDRTMRGDDLLPDALDVSTRAIGVNAPASAVWPSLVRTVRIGSRCGGESVPGPPSLAAGDEIPLGRDEIPLGRKGRMRVEVLEPEHSMVLRSDDGARVWSVGLYPEAPSAPGGAQIRLVSRNRVADPRSGLATSALWLYVLEPAGLLRERRMLLGIKQRAEQPTAGSAARAERPG